MPLEFKRIITILICIKMILFLYKLNSCKSNICKIRLKIKMGWMPRSPKANLRNIGENFNNFQFSFPRPRPSFNNQQIEFTISYQITF